VARVLQSETSAISAGGHLQKIMSEFARVATLQDLALFWGGSYNALERTTFVDAAIVQQTRTRCQVPEVADI